MDEMHLIELQTEWAESFFTIGKRENLNLEEVVDLVGFTVLSVLRWLYNEAENTAQPFPAGYLFQCLAIIEHGLAHVPEEIDSQPEYDTWIKKYCSPGPFQGQHGR